MRISVFSSPELQAAILGMKSLEREVRKQTRQGIKAMAQPAWQESVNGNTVTRLEARVLGATARAAVSDQNVQLQSARIGRSLSGGAKPADIVAGAEFGAGARARRIDATSKRGKPYRYTRITTAQFRRRNRSGYVVYPAAAQTIPRIASMVVQTVVRSFHEAIEGRS